MTQPSAALVQSDLSWARIVGESAARWDVAPMAGAEVTARSLRARADEAARWFASQPATRKRIGVVVVDVNEAICAWLRTPSLAPPVLAATLRAHAQDWGDLMPVTSFEPLAEPAVAAPRGKRGKKTTDAAADMDAGVALGVLCMPDAIIRLWLDALDSMNVRVGIVMSLWHAMARVWSDESGGDGIVASVLIEADQRLVWAWSQKGSLVCGGTVTLLPGTEATGAEESGPPAEAPAGDDAALMAAGRRLSLDWLTWSSHLGRVPDRVQIIGPDGRRLGQLLGERWGAGRIESREHVDPVAFAVEQLLGKLGDSAADDSNSRRLLTRLTQRPTRSVRARYRLTAAMLALAGVCLALVGQRLGSASGNFITQAINVQQQTRAEARKQVPEVPESGTMLDLRQILGAAAGKPVETFRPPPLPRPIYDELLRVLSIFEKYPAVKINGMAFDQEATGQGCRLQLRAPDRRTATEIFVAIQGSGKPIEWTRQQTGAGAAGAFDDLNLVGRWAD